MPISLSDGLRSMAFIWLSATPLAFAEGAFTLEDWLTTPDATKPLYVKAIMEQASVHKVSFNHPPEFYVTELNKFAKLSHTQKLDRYLDTSVAQNLATLAVINCDWNNGVQPYEFARTYFGAQQLEKLKLVYPDAVQKLEHNCL